MCMRAGINTNCINRQNIKPPETAEKCLLTKFGFELILVVELRSWIKLSDFFFLNIRNRNVRLCSTLKAFICIKTKTFSRHFVH